MRLATKLLLAALCLAGCQSPRALDTEPMSLGPEQQEAVRAQVEAAREARLWVDAWNQAADAGLGRPVLEAIALDTLEDEQGVGEDMMEELRARHGGLTEAGRERLRRMVREAGAEGDWRRAVDLAIVGADDPPAYRLAWQVYRDAPPTAAERVLARIREATDEDAED